MNQRARPTSITSLAILRYVRDNPHLYTGDIADALGVAYTVLYNSMQRLAANGLLQITDRYEIVITKTGVKFFEDRMAWIQGDA